MISGANEEQLELANARANVVMKLDNTSTYESWLIIDTYIESLEKENQELKKQLEEYQLQNIDLRADIMIQKMAFPHKAIKDKTFYELYDMPNYEDLLNQQKEFINYMMNTIENITHDETDDEEIKGYLIQRGNTFKEILSKYQEIIGENNER